MRYLAMVLLVLATACDPFAGKWSGQAAYSTARGTSAATFGLDLQRGGIDGGSVAWSDGYVANVRGAYLADGTATVTLLQPDDGGVISQSDGKIEVKAGRLAGAFSFTTQIPDIKGTMTFDLARE